jgi:hypothetical protein
LAANAFQRHHQLGCDHPSLHPSLLGGAALLMNSVLYRSIEQWKEGSSALVALGVIAGGPFVASQQSSAESLS